MLSDAAIDVNAVHGSGGGTEEEEGETALSLAAFNGDDAVVRALLSHPGIDVSAGKPWAPLQAALIESHHSTAELLLAHPRIDANRPFRNGNGTALHHCLRSLASGYCDPGIINSLLRAKADPLSWADFGTPRGLAQEWLGHMVSTTERGPLAIAAAYPNRDISRLLRDMTDAVKMMDARSWQRTRLRRRQPPSRRRQPPRQRQRKRQGHCLPSWTQRSRLILTLT